MSRARELSKVISSDHLTFHSTNVGIGNTTPAKKLDVDGTIRATEFITLDGSPIGGGGGGIGTALASTGVLKDIFFNNTKLLISDTTTIDAPNSAAGLCFTQYPDVEVSDTKDIIISDGDDFIIDLLGISTEGLTAASGAAVGYTDSDVDIHLNTLTANTNEILSWNGSDYDWITNDTFGNISVANLTASNVTIAGTLTYEDVTNVDSIGIITARSGVEFGTTGSSTLVVGDGTGIGIGTDNPDTTLDVRTTSTVGIQIVTKTASSNGAVLRLRKDDPVTLSTNDTVGSVSFTGTENSDVYIGEYASIQAKITTPTQSSEDGVLNFLTATGGTGTTKFSIDDTTCTFSAGLVEKCEIAGQSITAQTNNPIADGNVILFNASGSGSVTINFTGVHEKLDTGETCAFTVIMPAGGGYIGTINISGQTGITPQWLGGAPTSAGSSGRDIYSIQIIKTGTGASDYLTFASVSNFT